MIDDTEKELLQDEYTKLLDKLGIEYIHIPNRTFKGKCKNTKLKSLSDIMFLYKNIFYMRELGIKGRNKKQKDTQWEKMLRWYKQGANIKILTSIEGIKKDWKEIGLTL